MKTTLTLLERTIEVEAFDGSPVLIVSEGDISRETTRGRLFFELREFVTKSVGSEKELKEELAKVFAFFESLPALPESEPEPEEEAIDHA